MTTTLFTNPRKQGDIGVSAAIHYYTLKGYEILFPLTEATRYDLVVDTGEKLLRVQCKTSTYTENDGRSYQVGIATCGGNRSWSGVKKFISKDECDLVFIWCANDSLWEVPSEALHGKASFTACWKNRQYHVGGPEPLPPVKGGRPRLDQVSQCVDCGVEVSGRAKRCKTHAARQAQKTKITWLPDDELIAMTQEIGFSATARQLGVSDNAIRKRLRVRGLL